ncbi:UDP-N-acetylglucosamine transporter [Coccomyxa sp. Obi]|nr:UDP-N-acetylglucosamine transporter [Coccomyxa sp. Obi]
MSLHERNFVTRTSVTTSQSQWAEGKGAGIEELPVSSSVRQYDRATFPGAASGDIAELHERLSSSRASGTSADGLDQQMSAPKPERSWTVRVGERNYGQGDGLGSPVRGGEKTLVAFLSSKEGALGLLSMALLIFQGTALSLTLRFSRTREGTQYLASVAVVWTELIKLLVCMVAQMVECARSAGQRGLPFRDEMVHQAEEILGRSWPMLVPAALFVMQQVLVIVAASHLDAVTFQICSQSFKIMPTALFAVWLLGQYLAPLQWASLPVLAVGVVFVTMNGSTPAGGGSFAGESDLILGLAASALSGLSSAYAGVYFEKYVKGKQGQTLWIRNLQLSLYGVCLSLGYVYLKDGRSVAAGGLMQGFDGIVWGVVALQVFGGLIVGMVVKYADNILKNFANALSVIFTVIGAIPLFHQYPSGWFIVGVAAVMLSVFMYGKTTPQGYETFEACFKTLAGRNLLPSTIDDTAGIMRWLSPLRRRPDSASDKDGRGRCNARGTATRVILIASSIAILILLIALTHHPRTQEVMQRGAEELGKMLNKGFDRQRLPTSEASYATSSLDQLRQQSL